MIEHRFSGDILDSNADVIFNPVTEEGSMGRGLSKRVRKKYPAMYRHYRTLCMYKTDYDMLKYPYKIVNPTNNTKWIINIPIKDTWADTVTEFADATRSFIQFLNCVTFEMEGYEYYKQYDPVTLAIPNFFYYVEDRPMLDMINYIQHTCSVRSYTIKGVILYHNEIV